MSDFTHNFWSYYVGIITVVSIIACLILLWMSGKAKVAATQDNTTGHVWDGDLREMNNPLPMWWVGLFVVTIIFGLAYLFMFPGLGAFAGKLGWTQAEQYQAGAGQQIGQRQRHQRCHAHQADPHAPTPVRGGREEGRPAWPETAPRPTIGPAQATLAAL